MYQRTTNPDVIIDLSTGAVIPRGNYLWPDDEAQIQPLPDPSPAERFDVYCRTISDGVSAWLDGYVQSAYSYASIISAASYAGDKNPKFNAEGTAAKAWRSDCFVALYAAMPTYEAMPPEQWPTLAYVTAHLPQPSAYQWEPPT